LSLESHYIPFSTYSRNQYCQTRDLVEHMGLFFVRMPSCGMFYPQRCFRQRRIILLPLFKEDGGVTGST
jgi:hypothetical protein